MDVVDELDLFHVAHETRKVLKVAPETVQVVERTVDRDHLLDTHAGVRARGPRLPALHPMSASSGKHIERGHAGNGSGGHTEPVFLDIVMCHRTTEPCEVECVAADARPEP